MDDPDLSGTPPAHCQSEFPLRAAVVATVALVAGVLASFAAFAQSYQTRSVRDGVFSSRQIQRGNRMFLRVCMECHELDEFVGPDAYLDEMDGATVWEIFEYIWAEMPEDRPGWFAPEEYADVLSYILNVYGMPSGDDELPIDRASLEAIVIEGPAP